MATGIKYGSFDLQAGGVTVVETDVYNAPKKTVQAEKLAETDGSIVVKATLESKTFTVSGFLSSANAASLDALIDTFKAALNIEGQNFDIDYNSATRRWVATPQNITISRPKGLNTAAFTVEFFCASPVGSDIIGQTVLNPTAVTNSTAQLVVAMPGSYLAEPRIVLTIMSLTAAGNNTVAIGNGSTLRAISVSRTWAVGDVLEIDCLKKTLYINNTVVPFSGQFPKWDAGLGTISYLDDFSARSVLITASYTARYL